MNPIIRAGLLLIVLFASLGGCSSAARLTHPFSSSSRTAPPPAGLDEYKTLVARHVAEHNPDHRYTGSLPPLLPAIVVLEITVAPDGHLAHVKVQRSRDPAASRVALASMHRSDPLPRPRQLVQGTGNLTFSETFLFADPERYQLRSLADVQRSE